MSVSRYRTECGPFVCQQYRAYYAAHGFRKLGIKQKTNGSQWTDAKAYSVVTVFLQISLQCVD